MENEKSYPVSLTVDYPDRPLDRLSTFFRIFTAIPICIILGLLLAGGSGVQVSIAGFVILPTLLLILFRQKYPRWWYDWNFNLVNFAYRVGAYLALLTDEYPATDQEQYVHIRMPYPDVRTLNNALPLIKWFLAIPHYIVLAVLSVAAFVVVIIAWFAILFTRRLPKGMFDFIVGVMRWHLRVLAYAALMITDEYPPFELKA